MVFEVVRTDIADACKVQLYEGTHILGRGTFLSSLECSDKRVSRSHVQLTVTKDSVSLQSLHHNPCFFIKKEVQDTQVLHQNTTVTLSNGDRFGLLPSSYWYELHSTVSPALANSEESNNNVAVENIISKDGNDETNESSCNLEQDTTLTNNTLDVVSENMDVADDVPIQCSDLDEDTRPQRSESPSLISTVATATSPELMEASLNRVIKRSHSMDDVTNGQSPSKVRVKEEVLDNPTASTSTDTSQKDNDTKPAIVKSPSSPTIPVINTPSRERCMYGATCYRKNPVHKAQFSHPGDSDWGAGERGTCPWGAICQKRDARHWRDHIHPPGVLPPNNNAQRQGHTTVKKNIPKNDDIQKTDSSSEDDAGSPQDASLPPKRIRKLVRRVSWTDVGDGKISDEEHDPFSDDGDDEWTPSQYEPSTEEFTQMQKF